MAEYRRAEVHKLLTEKLDAVLISESDELTPIERKIAMGLFDDLAEVGINFDDMRLNPFGFEDGIYEMALGSIAVEGAEEEGKYDTVEFTFVFTEDGRNKGKEYVNRMPMPTKGHFVKAMGDEEATNKLNNMVERLVQRFFALGIEDPKHVDIATANKELRGNRYMVKLNTPTKNNPYNNQYVGWIRAKKSDAESVDALLDE